MFTVCPKCALTLIVTAADLRAGQGYVRCGRCSNVFNALVSLSDDRDSTPTLQTAEKQDESKGGKAKGEEPEKQEAEGARASSEEIPADEPISDKSLEFDPASTNVSDVFVEPEHGVATPIGTGTFKMLVLRNTDMSQIVPGAMFDPETGDDLEPVESAAEIPEALRIEIAAADATGEARAVDEARTIGEAGAASEADESTLEWLQGRGTAAEASPRNRRLWTGGSIALALVLLIQALHHYRDALASAPLFAPAVTGLYSALGLQLHPHWDLNAYDVRQFGATADGADSGSLRLRASIANTAQKAQPLPLLRVTMQDRYGNAIAARDVAPSLYASGRTGALAAGQRVDAQIVFHDPGRNAVGFELDACLPMAEARIVCALGQKPR